MCLDFKAGSPNPRLLTLLSQRCGTVTALHGDAREGPVIEETIGRSFPKLQTLVLRTCNPSGLETLLLTLPKLTRLRVGFRFSSTPSEVASALAQGKSLTALSFSVRLSGDAIFSSAEVATIVTASPRLRSLWICAVDDVGVTAIATHCEHLTSVSLNGEKVTDAGVVSLAERLTSLIALELVGTAVTDRSLEVLGANAVNLQSLTVRGCASVHGGALPNLAAACHQLRNIELHSCAYLTDEMVVGLAENAPRLSDVKILDSSQLADPSVTAIALNCPDIRSLHIERAGSFTHASVQRLAECTKLRMLRVGLSIRCTLRLALAHPRFASRWYSECIGFAALSSRADVLKSLHRAGVDVLTTGWAGSVLGFAAQAGSVEVTELLLQLSADPDAISICDRGNGAPLLYAAIGGHTDVVRLLLNVNANPDCQTEVYDDDRGERGRWTPLMCAAETGDIEAIKALLAAGATTTHKSIDGVDASSAASAAGNDHLVPLLSSTVSRLPVFPLLVFLVICKT